MTIFVLLTAIVLVLLAVSIHLGAMRSMNALMPRWPALNYYRVGILILVAIIAHLLEISLFAIGLGWLVSSGAHGQLDGAYQPGFTNDFYYSAITYTSTQKWQTKLIFVGNMVFIQIIVISPQIMKTLNTCLLLS